MGAAVWRQEADDYLSHHVTGPLEEPPALGTLLGLSLCSSGAGWHVLASFAKRQGKEQVRVPGLAFIPKIAGTQEPRASRPARHRQRSTNQQS